MEQQRNWSLDAPDGNTLPLRYKGRHVGAIFNIPGYPISVQLVCSTAIIKVLYVNDVDVAMEWLEDNEQLIWEFINATAHVKEKE